VEECYITLYTFLDPHNTSCFSFIFALIINSIDKILAHENHVGAHATLLLYAAAVSWNILHPGFCLIYIHISHISYLFI
jgi:hypothetical protein